MRNIVICCDGTGNEYGKNNTNVVETYALAVKNADQIVFYDPGIGTGGWEYEEEKGSLKAKADQATGYGLQKNVEDAYRLLMARYREGDRLYLFGFSRGAFTARSLAGMLHKCGLLRADSDNLVEYASKIYNTRDNDTIAAGFKSVFSRDCPAYFIGVWDTVESLVLNAGKKFNDCRLNPEVKFGYHALSIDERRKDFPPCLWEEDTLAPGQTIQQVWFPGVHSDVGGWYDERDLSNIALHWMLDRAKACGLQIDDARLATEYPFNAQGQQHESYSGFWKIRGSRVRQIPENSRLHQSVVDRLNQTANRYRPGNLPQNYRIEP